MARSTLPAAALLALLLAVGALAAVNINLTDKLVEATKKKAFEAMIDELQLDDMDVNQPDSKGRLPLVEAVRTKDVKYVDSLLQYGAQAKSKDPATGATPLHIAFQQNLVAIAKLLLSYGADPNEVDKGGKKARDFAPSKEIRELISVSDKMGAMGFEDEPGTWVLDKKGTKEQYWFNTKTEDSRWNTPPPCAWQVVEVQGHPVKYFNGITGQETTIVPPSLAWVKLRSEGQELYYNWKMNFTQIEVPYELPDEVLEKLDKNINVRWFNSKTEEYAWTDPNYHTLWRELKDEATSKTFWYNVETGITTWDLPDELAWVKEVDPEGRPYFFNRKTDEAVWDAPDHLAWVRHDSDL